MRALTDVELSVVSGGNNGHGHGRGRGGRNFDVDVAVVVAKQTATATATSGGVSISKTHGPLETGPGDLYIYTGDATATASNSITNNA